MNRIGITVTGSLMAAVSAAEAGQPVQTEIDSLVNSPDWQTLKSTWRTLNLIVPSEDYIFPIVPEKGDSIAALLNGLFTDHPFQSAELSRAADMVRSLAVQRTMRLSRINPMMLTRMMPPWTYTVYEDILFNFESRITTLTELLTENEISATEFIAARDTLLNKALAIALLEIINDPRRAGMYDYFPQTKHLTVDTILHRLDMSYRAALDSLALPEMHPYAENYETIVAQHEEFLKEYERFIEAAPVFRLLLEDLMEAQR